MTKLLLRHQSECRLRTVDIQSPPPDPVAMPDSLVLVPQVKVYPPPMPESLAMPTILPGHQQNVF